MEKKKTTIFVNNEKGGYEIRLNPDFSGLPEALSSLDISNRKLCIVSDSNVAPLYAEEVQKVLAKCCAKAVIYQFPAGEANKTLYTVKDLYEFLILQKFDRKDLLVALGGGVVGDLTGFAAATYLRGIDFIQIPTTLLAQVDSSIGGKTGVDFDAYKNMVGAFHMPRLVYMNLGVLNTLPDRQFAAGMAEIIKHGLIRDPKYYTWLMENQEQIEAKEYEALRHMIEVSCRIKGYVVEVDPTEKGIRAWLNFGHTAGHAVEKLMDFKLFHGECVAIGCVAAGWISKNRGSITKEQLDEMERVFTSYHLPVRVEGVVPEEVLATTKLDKKMEAGKIKFVLLKSIGEAIVARDVEDEELLDAIRYISKPASV